MGANRRGQLVGVSVVLLLLLAGGWALVSQRARVRAETARAQALVEETRASLESPDREKLTARPAHRTTITGAAARNVVARGRSQANATTAMIATTRYRPRMFGSKKMPFARKKRL